MPKRIVRHNPPLRPLISSVEAIRRSGMGSVMDVGIMQGRLSPPVHGRIQSFPFDSWMNEFALARHCGLRQIEWIFDAENWSTNPLVTPEGVKSINRLIGETSVRIDSICADYFMHEHLVSDDSSAVAVRAEMLKFVLHRAALVGARFLTVPFVDSSAICDRTSIKSAAHVLSNCASTARATGVRLCLETNLGPTELAGLLAQLDPEWVSVTYDIGNSASLGYDTDAEFDAYGDRIAVVHVKDRILNGGTVPLGHGAAKLPLVFARLVGVRFTGPLILQVARRDDEIAAAMQDLATVRRLYQQQADQLS